MSWNALLNGLLRWVQDAEKVLDLFCRMAGSEINFSKFTLSAILKACENSGNLRVGQMVQSWQLGLIVSLMSLLAVVLLICTPSPSGQVMHKKF